MVDNLSEENRRKTMQSVRSKHTKFEERITKALWKKGLRFRKNVKDLFGAPDMAIKKYKAVVFLDSCFWHGCELHSKIPDTNQEYWQRKILRNKKRDLEVNEHYRKKGWRILRVWEHEVKENPNLVLAGIIRFFEDAKHLKTTSTDNN